MKQTTFKDFIEEFYKKPFNQVPREEILDHAQTIFGFGISKSDLNDDGSDLEELKNILE